jgi:hypothetical protein
MTSQGQTCVDKPILDTLHFSVTDGGGVSRHTMTSAESPVNDLALYEALYNGR